MCFVYCWGIMEKAISDYNMRLILKYVIQLSGGHCALKRSVYDSVYKWTHNFTKFYLEFNFKEWQEIFFRSEIRIQSNVVDMTDEAFTCKNNSNWQWACEKNKVYFYFFIP